MHRPPPISTLTETLLPYTPLFRSSAGSWPTPPSTHRRNDEGVRSVTAAVGPARGDRLDLGPEFDAFHAVLVGVAEGRAFPAAERMIGDRHRDRHIDADHADRSEAHTSELQSLMRISYAVF